MGEITSENHDAHSPDSIRFVRLMDVCSDAVAICEAQNIVRCNWAFRLLTGCSSEQLIGESLESVVVPSRRVATKLQFDELSRAETPSEASFRTQLLRADGLSLDVFASLIGVGPWGESEQGVVFRLATASFFPTGLPAGHLAQLARLQRMAVFGELTASLLHELGQPLTAANGACEMLPSMLAADGSRSAEIVATSVGQATIQFRRIWEFVRQKGPRLDRVDVSVLVESVLELVSKVARHAGVRLEFLRGDVPQINADPSLLELLFVSLLRRSMTAVSSRSGGGRIEIVTRLSSDSNVEVIISHNGDVLPAEQRILQGDSGLQSHEQPALTLAICRQIVEENDGVFVIEQSQHDETGVAFRLMFPGHSV